MKIPQTFLSSVAGVALVTAVVVSPAGALEVAEDALVVIDATGLPEGAATSVTNSGTLGGIFENIGGGTNDPQVTGARITGQPGYPAGSPGTTGIVFDGDDFLSHLTAPGSGTYINAPAGVVGVDPTRTIEAWVLNPQIAGEETVVAWGKRGGGAGQNMSFNYGNHQNFGAVGHWGGGDIGWIDQDVTPGAPAAGEWHHLVYTYDGTTTRVYANGVLQNMETLGAGAINTHVDTPITIASQLEGTSANQAPVFTAGLRGSLTIGRLRVHDGVLSDAQVLANYTEEAGDFVGPGLPPGPTPKNPGALPIHRYTFNEGALTGNGSDGTVVHDVIGGADGLVRGAGATVTSTGLDLPGGSSATQAYVDLPNSLISSIGAGNGGSGKLTIEGWMTVQGGQAWSRIFDFGSSQPGELVGPGGAGEGQDYLIVTAQIGADTGARRVEFNDRDPDQGGGALSDVTTDTFGEEFHFALTLDETDGRIDYYENGLWKTTFTGPDSARNLANLNDVNNWLGRSNWTGDANTDGLYNEFRIYDAVLDRDEIFASYLAGPDTVIPEPSIPGLIGLGGLLVLLRRRRR